MRHLDDPDDHTVPAALTGGYVLDPSHTRLGFAARHAMVTKVRGSFTEFEGGGFFDVENNADRDPHLRSNDLFDTETYPEISFKSTAFEQPDELYWVTGDLMTKGIT